MAELPYPFARILPKMPDLRPILLGLALALALGSGFAQQPLAPPLTAEAIMIRVAANQDRAESERGHYVYVQHAQVVSRKGKTVMCDEITDSRITPTASGSDEQILKVNGRLLRNHQYDTYTSLPLAQKNEKNLIEADHGSLSIDLGDDDRNLVENMRSNLTNDKSKDGISSRLFPLTSKSQSGYTFELIGREHMNGRDVFHITFHPKEKDDYGWKGNAYIDTIAYQPVVISTDMARKIPFAVRTLLGTNLPGLGFTVVYAPLPDGVWFPVSFGTQFKIHALFFFSREIIIDAKNHDFEKTQVNSNIIYGENLTKPKLP